MDRGILQVDQGLDSQGNPTAFADLPPDHQAELRAAYEKAIDGPPMGMIDPVKRNLHFVDWLRKYGYQLD